jgi:formylglycine-generating enzyme
MRQLISDHRSSLFALALAFAPVLMGARFGMAETELVTRGIVATSPAGVRSVRVADGYMVPYVEKIPGTDVSFEMIPVPGGEFLMGSPPKEAHRHKDEGPQVRVKVEPFLVGKFELNRAEYSSFMAL